MAKGKGILQRHQVTDELAEIAKEDKGMEKLSNGSFINVLQSAQVKPNSA